MGPSCAKSGKMACLAKSALAQEWKIAHWMYKNSLKMSACKVNREMACGYTVLLSMHFGQNVMYKDAKKEKCDVVREIACGYTVLLSMHFGQKVMERMYKSGDVVENGPEKAGSRCKSSLKWLKYKATRKIDLTTVSRRCQPSSLRKSSIDPRKPLKPRGKNREKAKISRKWLWPADLKNGFC